MRLLLVPAFLCAALSVAVGQDRAASPNERPAARLPDSDKSAPEGQPKAEGAKKSRGAVEFRIGYYDNDDDDSSGNPFLDESLTDIEPVVIVEFQATDKLRLSLMGSYDLVSSASIARLNDYDQRSGASSDNYFGLDLAARYEASEDFRWNAHAGASREYDYLSFGFGGGAEIDLLEDNVTLSGGLNVFFDQVTKVIRFNGQDEGTDNRLSVTVNFGYYQILSPTVHFSLGTSLTYQSGFLQTAYNGVVLEDPSRPQSDSLNPDFFLDLPRGGGLPLPGGVSIEAEKLPETRIRVAVFGEIRKGFPSTGTGLGFATRLYADDWGIVSAAPELRLYQWIVQDLLRVRVRYRFYNQTAADAYDDHFLVPISARSRDPFRPNKERTQDADLGAFFSNTIGLKLVLTPAEGVTVDVGGDYVLRSDGINQLLFSFGVRWEF
ncbi:MAG: DUF3570 domain-containing protein [Planctomycetes bacterium]|nr:DUF3570 domain-containing protein [Planctomycetota bacterium]